MAFNSYQFILFFLPVMLIMYYALGRLKNKLFAKLFLLAASLFFYGYTNVSYLWAIGASVFLNYLLAYAIRTINLKTNVSKKELLCTALLIVGLFINVGSLLFYKSTNFFISTINTVFSKEYTLLKLIAPLGISFFTFKQISYLVDTYRARGSLWYSFLDYVNYIIFFPEILSGPISLHHEIIPCFSKPETFQFQSDNFIAGIYQFACGLAKKVLIADVLANFVDASFVYREVPNSLLAIMGILAYTMQIYFDFSGYSDMALGVAKMINIDIVNNFDSPYKANSVSEFWKKWHISLTRFFTKYIYFPLGGSRKNIIRTCFNTILVFLISGFWHGANWTFILWGGAYGILLVFERLLNIRSPKKPIAKVIGRISTLMIVSLLWVFFRAESVDLAITLIKEAFSFKFCALDPATTQLFVSPILEYILSVFGASSISAFVPYIFLLVCILLVECFRNTTENIRLNRHKNITCAIVSAALIVASLMSFSSVSKFIYWNF